MTRLSSGGGHSGSGGGTLPRLESGWSALTRAGWAAHTLLSPVTGAPSLTPGNVTGPPTLIMGPDDILALGTGAWQITPLLEGCGPWSAVFPITDPLLLPTVTPLMVTSVGPEISRGPDTGLR